jgi:methionine biosynthesis protein MetW
MTKAVENNIRYDLEIIADLIKPNSKVLDIGCSTGDLLYYLKQNKNVDGRGLEISQVKVSQALAKGLSAIQGNAEDDLHCYPDQSFDYTILSQTLQATNKPKEILLEMLRISKFAVVSLPNFAYFKNRLQLLLKGTMPVNKTIPFQWFETPNIHFCSMRDFEKLCQAENLKIEEKIFLAADKKLPSILNNQITSNLLAEYGIFLISKKEFSATGQEEFIFSKNNNIPFKAVTCLSSVNSSK